MPRVKRATPSRASRATKPRVPPQPGLPRTVLHKPYRLSGPYRFFVGGEHRNTCVRRGVAVSGRSGGRVYSNTRSTALGLVRKGTSSVELVVPSLQSNLLQTEKNTKHFLSMLLP